MVLTGRNGGRGVAGGAPGGGTEMFSNKIVYNSGQSTRKENYVFWNSMKIQCVGKKKVRERHHM